MNGYERIEAMLTGGQPDCLPFMPITMMFAADQIPVPYGQYATDYRKLVDAQLRTAEAFDIDYVSVISDPAREAADCGANIQYFDDQPPAIDEVNARLADKTSLATLEMPDPLAGRRMRDRIDAAALLREKVGKDLAVEGWVEGPCAESADLRGINHLMMDFFDDPAFVRDLFEFTTRLAIRFAEAQIDAGVDFIGIGDAAASLVGPTVYRDYVLPGEKRIVEAIHARGAKARLHICGNTNAILADMAQTGCDFIDLDAQVDMCKARESMGADQVIAGNIHPVLTLRNGTPETVETALEACFEACRPRYMVGAGCEVPRDTPHENLVAMRDFARARTP